MKMNIIAKSACIILTVTFIQCNSESFKPNPLLSDYCFEIEVSPNCQCARVISCFEMPQRPMFNSSFWIYAKPWKDSLLSNDFQLTFERNTRDVKKIVKNPGGEILIYDSNKLIRINLTIPYFDSVHNVIKQVVFPYNGIYSVEWYSSYKRK